MIQLNTFLRLTEILQYYRLYIYYLLDSSFYLAAVKHFVTVSGKVLYKESSLLLIVVVAVVAVVVIVVVVLLAGSAFLWVANLFFLISCWTFALFCEGRANRSRLMT